MKSRVKQNLVAKRGIASVGKALSIAAHERLLKGFSLVVSSGGVALVRRMRNTLCREQLYMHLQTYILKSKELLLVADCFKPKIYHVVLSFFRHICQEPMVVIPRRKKVPGSTILMKHRTDVQLKYCLCTSHKN